MRFMKRARARDEDYELPPTMLAVHRHPRTRRLHRLPECRAMKYQGKRGLEPLLLRSDKLNEAGDPCRFCFGS